MADHEDIAAARPRRRPTHPGAIFRSTVLPSLNMTVTDAAKRLHVTRQQLHRVLSGESAVSPQMAYRLGRFCGNGPELWINMQVAFDMWQAGQQMRDELEAITPAVPTDLYAEP